MADSVADDQSSPGSSAARAAVCADEGLSGAAARPRLTTGLAHVRRPELLHRRAEANEIVNAVPKRSHEAESNFR